MGRTLPTSTQLIQEFEATWRPYARALRKEDREVLAELFAMLRLQSAPMAYAAGPEPFQVFMLAMLGGLLKRLIQLEQIVAGLPVESNVRGDDLATPSHLSPDGDA